MNDPQQTQTRSVLPLFILAIVPAAFTGVMIFKYCVDVPFWDEWHVVSLLEKFAQGTLSFRDLYAQQNEYRQFFPNLVFVAVGWLTRWDVRYLMGINFLTACLVSFNVYQLGKHTLAGEPSLRLWTYLLANLLIFSPIQHENWLQGQQFIYFVPAACLTSCMLVAYSGRFHTGAKFLICGVLATISTFSSANGILCWVVVLPVLAWSSNRSELWGKKWWILGWLAALCLSAFLYFYDYRSSSGRPPLFTALSNPGASVLYFLAVLGRPLALGRLAFAVSVGSILVILFVWSALQFWGFLKHDANEARRAICWLMIGTYSLLTAILITIGRAGFGLDQSLAATRYSTFTIYLAVALVLLFAIILSNQAQKADSLHTRLSYTRVRRFLCALLIVLHIPIYLLGIRQMSSFRVALLHSKACALLANVVSDACITQKVYSNFQVFKQQINTADRLGFLRPDLVKSNRVQDIEARDAGAPRNYGSFQGLIHLEGDKYIASGWAFLPHRGEPADAVVLAYERVGDPAIIFAIADSNRQRDFISALLGRGVYGDSRWSESFSVSGFGPNRTTLTAWAFDAYTGKAYRLDGSQVVEKPASPERH
ncbi:MAG: hypothetical protein ACREBG_06525 [Pyrinomonadaceae bacterium]